MIEIHSNSKELLLVLSVVGRHPDPPPGPEDHFGEVPPALKEDQEINFVGLLTGSNA
jgi:hypothetical protein